MTNAEISDAMMKAFNEADWDTWRSFMAPDVTMQDLCKQGWVAVAPGEPMSQSIQLLHLNKASVEHFISKLADGRAFSLEMIKG